MKRIIWHWTAGAPGVNPHEADSYHFVIDANGREVAGVPVSRNRAPLVNGAYAAHTLNCNTDSIGISMDAMANAQERPFYAGSNPITMPQLEGLVLCTVRNCLEYDIEVSRATTLSHAEVERTLGIKQRQKWDIMWLPGMDGPADPVAVGDIIRGLVRDAIGQRRPGIPRPTIPAAVAGRQTVSQGDRGPFVQEMQNHLDASGYPVKADGIFGPATAAALREFQTRAGLKADAICGPHTWAALMKV